MQYISRNMRLFPLVMYFSGFSREVCKNQCTQNDQIPKNVKNVEVFVPGNSWGAERLVYEIRDGETRFIGWVTYRVRKAKFDTECATVIVR